MRISDWSSDVCSSDLTRRLQFDRGHRGPTRRADKTAAFICLLGPIDPEAVVRRADDASDLDRHGAATDFGERIGGTGIFAEEQGTAPGRKEIGRASWRERVCQYV